MANSLNKVQLIGNLTRDPELKKAGEVSVAEIGIATNRKWKGKDGDMQEKVEFHNVTVWRGLSDVCAKYLTKGAKVYFSGRLETQTWENDNGEKRYKTIIIADEMIMLGGKKDSKTVKVAKETLSVDDLPF